MTSDREDVGGKTRDSVLHRLTVRLVKAVSNLLEVSEPKRKRPRNLYIRGAKGLVTRPYNER